MVVRGRIDLILSASSSVHQDKSFDIPNTFLPYLQVPETEGILLSFKKKSEIWPYHVTIFEKLTLRLTVTLFGIFFRGPAVLEPSGSTGGKIELIRSPEVD